MAPRVEAETKAKPEATAPPKTLVAIPDAGGTRSTAIAAIPVDPPKSPARLTVLVSPWGNVWINGKPRGVAPLKNALLKPGDYRIGAGQSKPSHKRTVRLRPGQRETIRFDLTD